MLGRETACTDGEANRRDNSEPDEREHDTGSPAEERHDDEEQKREAADPGEEGEQSCVSTLARDAPRPSAARRPCACRICRRRPLVRVAFDDEPAAQHPELTGELVLAGVLRHELEGHLLEGRQHGALAEGREDDVLGAGGGFLAREDDAERLADVPVQDRRLIAAPHPNVDGPDL